MAEFYREEVLARSRALFPKVKQWGAKRDDVTLIGGWAVHELVDPLRAQQSRDLDVVLHTEEALAAFSAQLPHWNLQWRTKGRRTFKDCHFTNDPERTIIVDVFTDSAFGQDLFGLQATSNVKRVHGQGFVPTVEFLLDDKLRVLPLRQERDLEFKQLKDALDAYNLVFHNKARILPRTLQAAVAPEERRAALAVVQELRPQEQRFAQELAILKEWLAE